MTSHSILYTIECNNTSTRVPVKMYINIITNAQYCYSIWQYNLKENMKKSLLKNKLNVSCSVTYSANRGEYCPTFTLQSCMASPRSYHLLKNWFWPGKSWHLNDIYQHKTKTDIIFSPVLLPDFFRSCEQLFGSHPLDEGHLGYLPVYSFYTSDFKYNIG